jgi:DNA excision repair protein ERCC-2
MTPPKASNSATRPVRDAQAVSVELIRTSPMPSHTLLAWAPPSVRGLCRTSPPRMPPLLRFNDADRVLEMSVHDVVDAGPPSGHLSMAVSWGGRARMAAGVAAHQIYQSHRSLEDDQFASEVQVKHRMLVREWEVLITGRMDGLTQEGDYWVVEEVKSSALGYERLSRLVPDDLPDAVLQLRMYLHALEAQGRRAVGSLVLISVADGTQHLMQVDPDPGFSGFLIDQLGWIIQRREQYLAWIARRRDAVVPFAHDDWRLGQEELATEVEDAVARGGHLLLNAPTGLGKTAGVLYGVLAEAYRTDRRVFFATARTTQQRIVEDTIRKLSQAGLPIRAVSIRARDKACLNEVVSCRPDCCKFANGHHDRVRKGHLHDAMWTEDNGVVRVPGPDDVVDTAQQHTVCPFALSMELARTADIIIGDYNYAFDPSRRIGPLADAPGDWVVVVDEAHNLPDRARGYASPSLVRSKLAECAEALGDQPAYIGCAELVVDLLGWMDSSLEVVPAGGAVASSLEDGLNAKEIQQFAGRFEDIGMDYALLKAEIPVFEVGDPFEDIGRSLARLRSTLDRAGEETLVIWRARGGREAAGLELLCRDPGPVLEPSFADFSASVIMSATLRPIEFYASMFGLESGRAIASEFDSPFPPENRRVLVVPDVSTEYRKRARDRDAIASHVESIIKAVPGNVAVFFSSFDLRDSIAGEMGLTGRPVIFQERNMSEADRDAVLNTLQQGKNHVLLGVLGGIFSEGIDLPGAGLLAAVIVGPALPAVGLERKLMSAWFQESHGHGFRYAYQVPGMARVVQAAGRVIRTSDDVGAIVLVGRRFLQRDYQSFFPPDWSPIETQDPASALAGLWADDPVTP